jgi:hypothetical protein
LKKNNQYKNNQDMPWLFLVAEWLWRGEGGMRTRWRLPIAATLILTVSLLGVGLSSSVALAAANGPKAASISPALSAGNCYTAEWQPVLNGTNPPRIAGMVTTTCVPPPTEILIEAFTFWDWNTRTNQWYSAPGGVGGGVNVAVDTGNVNVVSTSYPNRWHITGEIAAYYTNGVMNKLLLGDSAQVTLNYTL